MKDKPDKFHRHEALHMSIFFAESVERELMDNLFVKSDAECAKLAEKAMMTLHDLYQTIGAKHFDD